MTGTELQQYFGTHMNQFDSRLKIGSRDIFYWLTQAQTKMITEAYGEFEQERRLGDILRPFQCRSEALTTTDAFTGNDKADLPEDFLYPLAFRAEVGYTKGELDYGVTEEGFRFFNGTDYKQHTVLCKLVQKDDVYRLLLDPFNRTTHNEPLLTQEKDFVLVYNSPYFLARKVLFEYVQTPCDVTRENGSKLPDHHHKGLVELAVTLFMDNTRGLKSKLQTETPTG